MIRQKTEKIIICLVFMFSVSFVLLPIVVAAAGLVPCGDAGEPICTWCHLGVMAENIFNFAVKNIVIPIAVAVVIWGGFVIMTAGGSPERVKKGKDVIKAAVIGIVIALGAWLIIDTIIKLVLQADIGPWNKIKCKL